MKKVLTFILLFSFTFLVFKGITLAEDNTVNIEYNAQTKKFSFDENQDLFVNLKNVVPGDNLTQKINLKVINPNENEAVKIYLKAENPNDDYNILEGLEGVSLTVNSNDINIEEKIYNPLLLGTFSDNDEENIEVNLLVDKTVGNEIADLYAEVEWIFSAETILNTDTLPQTGDTSDFSRWIVIIAISFIGMIMVGIMLKIRKSKTN